MTTVATLLPYAFRYALGRSSYAPADVMSVLRTHGRELDEGARQAIVREIRRELEMSLRGLRNPSLPYAGEWRETMEYLEGLGS